MGAYTQQNREDWVRKNLPRIEAQGLSYRQIALEVRKEFGLQKPPSTATIGRDLLKIRDETAPEVFGLEVGRPSEADVVFDLCLAALDAGIPREALRLEVPITLPDASRLKADLALVSPEQKILALVEVKRDRRSSEGGIQLQKYQSSGQPYQYCRGPNDIDRTVDWLYLIQAGAWMVLTSWKAPNSLAA